MKTTLPAAIATIEEAQVMYERTLWIFKAINPAKKYSQFQYYDAKFEHVNCGDCQKGMILKIDDMYYLYSGEKNFHTSDTTAKSRILFKNGKKIVKEILS